MSLREHPTETAPNSLAHLFCEPVARERVPQWSECVRARCPIATRYRALQAVNVPLRHVIYEKLRLRRKVKREVYMRRFYQFD